MSKIIFGDTLEILPTIEAESVDLICTDPPFNLTSHAWDQFSSQKDYLNWSRKWMEQCFRILKPTGAFYCFQDWRSVADYVILLKEIFPYFQNWITWERIKGRASKINWKNTKEEILYFSKSKTPKFYEQKKLRPVIAPYKDNEGKPKGWFISEIGERVRWTGVGNVWHYTSPVWSQKDEKPVHPCQKPVMMLERIIQAHTDETDMILDCFAGSGSTLVAAKKLNRNFIGIESNEKYYNISLSRLNNLTGA